ncbi:MAG: 2-hydroxyacyl-CoA dehydratase [Planctomycetaceae bacterium]|jgi:predicted nucleotide-binding protein (sugar kinase/HSP70/actin superfamily)|nr:2-hydroxyacyl-CoA dehydratase [Planctomycetaceae bacterium]
MTENITGRTSSIKPVCKIPQRPPVFYATDKERFTILCPQMSPIHFSLLQNSFAEEGYHLDVLPEVDRDCVEEGLRYVNNDACYPAIVVVGQLIQALKSGRYHPDRTALLISQTCGGCRSTNYQAFLKIAVQKAGFLNTPIIPFNINLSSGRNSEGIQMTLPMIKKLIRIFLFGDLLMRLSNHCRPYETLPGSTETMLNTWMDYLKTGITQEKRFDITQHAAKIVKAFESLPLTGENSKPKVGVVGEVLLKYHQGANNHLVSIIEQEGGEAVVPDILDFALYCLTGDRFKTVFTRVPFFTRLRSAFLVRLLEYYRGKIRKVLKNSHRFVPSEHINHLAKQAKSVLSTCNQTGEGWLLTADMVEFMETGVPNVICVQPFGCLPNHITGKGVIKELKRRYRNVNITPIDFDPGTTEVNQLNRIKLMMAVANKNRLTAFPDGHG